MSRIVSILITLLVSISFFSCKKDVAIQGENLYILNSTELINQIFSSEFFIDCDCIVEPHNEPFLERPEYLDILFEKLKISSKSTLDSLLDLSQKLQLNKVFTNRKIKIISRDKFESIIVNNNKEDRYKILTKMCPKKTYTISKPIFDKNFEIAFIDIQSIYGCISSEAYICRLKNGKWEFNFLHSD